MRLTKNLLTTLTLQIRNEGDVNVAILTCHGEEWGSLEVK